jgi:outer membrane protein assembly factor BamB
MIYSLLDLDIAFDDIRAKFVTAFDDSEPRFEDKVNNQFKNTSDNTKIVFANVEYLWARPMDNISAEKKCSYALRWLSDTFQVVSGDRYFFSHPDTIANLGSWYLRNKYWELVALLRILSILVKKTEIDDGG